MNDMLNIPGLLTRPHTSPCEKQSSGAVICTFKVPAPPFLPSAHVLLRQHVDTKLHQIPHLWHPLRFNCLALCVPEWFGEGE